MRKEASMEKIIKYEAPSIEDHGDLAELTAGKNHGTHFDATFTAGEPVVPVTFTTP